MTGWTLRCPVCHRVVLPEEAPLHVTVAPRLAYHLRDAHPYEADILRLHLNHPPAEWPEIVGEVA